MKISLVMTLIGKDRPGLVEAMSCLVADHGGNWLESRMSHLAGKFAGILRVEVERENVDALTKALLALQSEGLDVLIEAAGEAPTEKPAHTYRVEVVGHDRPGIVKQISHAIAAQNFNVEELSTHYESAPMTGDMLFKASATISASGAVSVEELQGTLEELADDLMVDVSAA